MTIFVYKEYFDEEEYNTEIIKLFYNYENALDFLKARFLSFNSEYGSSLESIHNAMISENTPLFDDNDVFEINDDNAFIALGNGNGGTSYYIVEKTEVA